MPEQIYQSFSEYHVRSELSKFPRIHRSCGSDKIQLVKTERSANEVYFPAVPELVVGIVLDGDLPFRFDLGAGWSSASRLQKGDIRLCLPNTEAKYECGDDYSLLLVCLPQAMVDCVLQGAPQTDSNAFEPLHTQSAFRDNIVQELVMGLWFESEQSAVASDLMADGLALSLVAQLLKHVGPKIRNMPATNGTWPGPPDRPAAIASQINRTGSPADRRIARAIDYVEAHIGERLNVAELAAIACLSAGHFSRAFKAAMGEPVWSFVQRRRGERAMEMLRHTDFPVADIAYACGFAHQGHLTACFKRQFGITPGVVRQA
ncbi:helix-turn-helix domain-containing protein [Roseobacter weihaiensis]|uniref:helix-turn-helix domain-containing protein n=1 Tax=Roseobacter weihaiensis TaxID=2763262 RepID=UPI001D0B57EA|nr:AraC family transcriptional regulator [Roseobacter sp. H9]